MGSVGEFILCMLDPEVLVEAEIDQSVVAAPAVCLERGFGFHFAANHRLQRGIRDIWHDLGVDLAAAFEQAEDDGFSAGSATSFAAHATPPEVGFDSPWKGELREQASAMRTRILRNIAFTGRSEMPVTAAV